MGDLRQLPECRLGRFEKAPDQGLHKLARTDLATTALPAAATTMFRRTFDQHELQGLLHIG